MKLYIKGKGEITLTQNDYLAEGGEGKIFAKGGTAYKLYNDPNKMIPLAKIGELGVLQNPKIIRPMDVVFDKVNNPIGYTMRHLSNTLSLCQLFTKGFRDRNSISPNMMLELVKDMQKTFHHIHNNGLLIVDANEMNFLVDNTFKDVYFIDVDSYQTPNYPATALMESIRDRHSLGKFNQNTDWFAWGIVTFQMFIGIHPYKGKHPTYNGMNERMEKNISVLSKDVGIPPVCQPFANIPPTLLAWYSAVFQEGKRIPPPIDYDGMTVITTQVIRHIAGTDKFEINLLHTAVDDIAEYLSCNGVRITLTTDKASSCAGQVYIALTDKMGSDYYAHIENGIVALSDKRGKAVGVNIAAEQMASYSGHVYFKNGAKMFRLELHEMKSGIIASARQVGNVHEKATKMYDGIAIQNIFGTAHLMFFPQPNVNRDFAIPEIKGKIVDAKYDNRVAMVIAVDKQGKYNRYVLRFSKDFDKYEVLQTVPDITFTGINFVVIDKGICCHINEKGEVELFTNQIGNGLMKIVDDPMVKTDMRLFKDGDQVLFAKGKEMYTLKMK